MPKRKKPYNGPRRPPEDWYMNAFDFKLIEEIDGYKIRLQVSAPEIEAKEIEVHRRQVKLYGLATGTVSIPEFLCKKYGI